MKYAYAKMEIVEITIITVSTLYSSLLIVSQLFMVPRPNDAEEPSARSKRDTHLSLLL